MSEVAETLQNGLSERVVSSPNDVGTIIGVTTIMEYINGLMVGSVPQEFYETLVSTFGTKNVNRMIALGGVKYIKAVMETAQKRANEEARSTEEILSEEREQVVVILDRIFGD